VALYKACDLASKLTQAGHEVRALLTPRAAELVAPQLFEAVTGQPAATSEWGDARRRAMDHIEDARWAELALAAPATADLIARLAVGMADDLVTTALLALEHDVPRLLCPAMNPTMLAHPATQRNLSRLREDGWEVVEPGEGLTACGEHGQGRLAEPADIAARVRAILGG
jgi:phosphopantothenoylcysteine decarboxylase/phosphopantothenate--cysteine ligase